MTFSGSTATLSGSFTYDADTNTYSNINITVVAGANPNGVVPGAYQFQTPGTTIGNDSLFVTTSSGDLTGLPTLFLYFTSEPD